MRRAAFFKGLSWLIVLNLLVKPVWIFAIDRAVQNEVGNAVYGTYFSLFNLSYVLLFIADAGLSNMLNQRLAAEEKVSAGQLLQIKFLLLLFYVVACCLTGWLTHISEWTVLFYVIGIQVLTSMFVFLRSLITAHQYFRADAFFSVADKSLMVLLCGTIFYGIVAQITIVRFLQLQTASLALTVSAAFFFVRQYKLLPIENRQHNSAVLKFTAPFAAIILLMSLHCRLDAFLLERLHANGATEAGIYAAAYRLLDAGNTAGWLAASFLVPFIARNKRGRSTVASVVLTVRHALLFLSVSVVVLVMQFAPWLQKVLYHNNEGYQIQVLQYCLLCLPAYYLVHVYGAVLTATSKFVVFLKILGGCVIFNVVMNVYLVPKYGAFGCCLTALVSQYTCGIALMLASGKKLRLPLGFKWLFGYLFWAGALYGMLWAGKSTGLSLWIILAAFFLGATVFFATQKAFFRKAVSLFTK